MFISISGVLLVIVFGYFVVNVISPRKKFLEKISLAYIFGFGIFTFALFISNWFFKMPFSRNSSWLLLIFLSIVAFFVNIYRKAYPIQFVGFGRRIHLKFIKFSRFELMILVIIVFLCVSSIAANIFWPVRDWDAITLYDFRAKVLLAQSQISPALLFRYYLQYPLYTSLSHFWFYVNGIKNPMFFYSLNYISLVILFYALVKRIASRSNALFFTFLLAISSVIYQNSMIAYTNLPYTTMLVLGSLYLFFWIKQNGKDDLIISMLLISLSTWVRSSEPFWAIPLGFASLILLKRQKFFMAAVYPIVVFTTRNSWFAFKKYVFGSSPSTFGSIRLAAFRVDRFFEVGRYILKNAILPYKIFLAIFIFALLILFTKKSKINFSQIYLALLIIAVFLGEFAGTYIISFSYDKWVLVGDSVTRMMFFIIPLIIFFVAVSFETLDFLHFRSKR